MTILRGYQQAATDAVRDRISRGKKRLVVVAPTGAGKGTWAAWMLWSAQQKGKRAVFFVHRSEIILDIYDRVIDQGVLRIGAILGDAEKRITPKGRQVRVDPHAPVQVASVDSFRYRDPPPADLVIVDECHRSMSATYRRILESYKDAVVIGTTATPVRLDGKTLDDIFDDIVIMAKPSELVANGSILLPRIFSVHKDNLPDLTKVRKVGGDYDTNELDLVMNKKVLVGSIVEHWKSRAEGRHTIVSACSISHAQKIVESFREEGIDARAVAGSMKRSERDAIMKSFRDEEFSIIVQCNLLAEGFDLPKVKCVILARPTESVTFYLQMVGRGLRPYGDETALILDHAGIVMSLGRPCDDRDWESLWLGQKDEFLLKAPKMKTCPGNTSFCGSILPMSEKVCPDCGFEFGAEKMERSDSSPREIDGQLVEIEPGMKIEFSEEEKRAAWDKICQRDSVRKGGRAMAAQKFRNRFSENPKDDWPDPVSIRVWTERDKQKAFGKYKALAKREGRDAAWVRMKYMMDTSEEPPAEWTK